MNDYRDFCKPKLADLLDSLGLDRTYVRAEGVMLTDSDGREVIDFVGGFGAALIGHNHPAMRAELHRLVDACEPVHVQASRRAAAGELARRLSGLTGVATGYNVNFSNSGAEAIEAALKHAYKVRFDAVRREYERLTRILGDFYYRMEEAHPDVVVPGGKTLTDFRDDLDEYNLAQFEQFQNHPVVIACKGSYHGKTASALKVTFNKTFREAYEGLSAIKACFVSPQQPERIGEIINEECCTFLYPVLGDGGIELRPVRMGTVIALMLEPILGEGGVKPLPDAFLAHLAAHHGEWQVPFIVDEIQTGCGRTGAMFAWRQGPLATIAPDYLVLSKALGGGLAKIGATLIRKDIYDDDFGILHTSTFGEDELSSRLALKFLDLLHADDGRLLTDIVAKGEHLRAGLRALQGEFPTVIKEVRGRGLMVAIEFGALAERSPFFRSSGKQGFLSLLISSWLLHHHHLRTFAPLTAMLKGNPGKNRQSVLRIQPPALISVAQLDALVAALREALVIVTRNNEYALIAHLMRLPLTAEQRQDPAAFPARFPISGGPGGAAHRDESEQPGAAGIMATVPAEPGCDGHRRIDTRTGFVVHPTTVDNLVEYYFPSFAHFAAPASAVEDWWNRVSRFLEPLHVRSHQVSANDFVVENNLIFVPYLPATITATVGRDGDARRRQEIRDKINDAVTIAKELGDENIPVTMVGLGAYTSIATDNGTLINDYEMAITSGNAYTTALTVLGVIAAAQRCGLDLTHAEVAVVGAAGNIGQVVARILAPRVGSLSLVGSERRDALARLRVSALACVQDVLAAGDEADGFLARRLRAWLAARPDISPHAWRAWALAGDAGLIGVEHRAVRAALAEAPGIGLHQGCDLTALGNADVVVIATSSHRSDLVTPAMVKSGAIVGCTSVPSNLAATFQGSEAIVFDGGLARLPESSAIDFVGMPKGGDAYGCLAETLLLGFEGASHSFCKGALTADQVRRTMAMADAFGFTLAPLTYRDAPLPV